MITPPSASKKKLRIQIRINLQMASKMYGIFSLFYQLFKGLSIYLEVTLCIRIRIHIMVKNWIRINIILADPEWFIKIWVRSLPCFPIQKCANKLQIIRIRRSAAGNKWFENILKVFQFWGSGSGQIRNFLLDPDPESNKEKSFRIRAARTRNENETKLLW